MLERLFPAVPSPEMIQRLVTLAWYDGARTGLVAGLIVGIVLGYLLGRDRRAPGPAPAKE